MSKIKVIEILVVAIVLFFIVFLIGLIGCEDEVEAFESNGTDESFVPTIHTDVMFTYRDEELTLNIIDGEIVCSRSAEKAIEIIFKSLYVGYDIGIDDDVNDLSVRFPEPNEP